MKNSTLLFFIFLSFSLSAQTLQRQTVWDSTRVDGQRFVISYPYEEVHIRLVDSLNMINDSVWEVVPGYISVVNSTATFRAMRVRIVDGDTLSRGEVITVPLNEIGNNAYQFLVGNPTKKKVKKSTKYWMTRKLNQE